MSHSVKKWYTSMPLILLILLNIIPSAFLSKLAFDNAPETYLPKDQPSVILENEIRAIFPDDQTAFILFHGADLYEDEFLNNLEHAARKIKRSELIERVINVTEMEHIGVAEDGFEVSYLLGKETRKKIKEASKRFDVANADRFAGGLVVAQSSDYMAMIIRPISTLNTTLQRIRLMDGVNQVLTEYQLNRAVVAIAGTVPVEIEQFNSMLRDTMMFVPATMLIGWFFIWILYRRFMAVVMSGLVTGAVVNLSLLFFVLFSLPYTLISAMLPPLLAALSTAFLIHFYSYMQLASSYHYVSQKRVDFVLKQIKKPAFFTVLTTVLGFFSLALSPIPPIKHFGLMAGAGMIILFVLVIYVLPVIFAQLDDSIWQQAKKGRSLISRSLGFMLHLSIRHAGKVVAVMLMLLIVGIPFVFKVTAETNMLAFFPDAHYITKNSELIEEKLTGVMALEIDLYTKDRDGFKKSANLKQLKSFQQWLEQQPEIDRSNSIVDMVEEMHYSFNQGDKKYQIIPDNDQLISQYFFIYDGNEVYELVNRDFSQARVLLSVNQHNSSKVRLLVTRISDYLQQHNAQNLKWQIAGDGKLFSDQDVLLVSGQIKSLIAAVILIFVMMLLLWKNLSYALLTMIPNLSPIIFIFILMGVLGLWLDMATAMIASVAIGIAVDDTIHLFHGYKKRIDKGCTVLYSLVRSYYRTGRAIIVTTIILCSQFFLLFFSQFVPTSNFGLLTATGLLMALVFDLILLPALIILIYRR